ncbi:hypothetical protein IWQ61_002213 [Dispira simplex]|nr:hypothetical protein IWQ61_002213 [Dispira simplex]
MDSSVSLLAGLPVDPPLGDIVVPLALPGDVSQDEDLLSSDSSEGSSWESDDDSASSDPNEQTGRTPRQSPPYHCTYRGCTKTYRKRWLFRNHLYTHTGERPYACPEPGCGKTFIRKTSLQFHAYAHLPYEQRPYGCEFPNCGARFRTSSTLKKHLAIHTNAKPYICPVEGCGMGFTKKFQLSRHVSEHTGKLPHICDAPGCDKSFQYPSQLRKHQLVHGSPGQPPRYLCGHEGCHQGFNKWSDFQTHVRTEHAKRQCGVCGRILKSQSSLRSHMRNVHGPNQMLHTCPWDGCGKQLTKARHLEDHIRWVHENRRDFPCLIPGCGASLTTKATLHRHCRSKHDGQMMDPETRTIVPVQPIQATPSKRKRAQSLVDATPPPAKKLLDRRQSMDKLRSSNEPTAAEELTGYDYANVDTTRRKYQCPIPHCLYRYVRKGNVKQHILRSHPLPTMVQSLLQDTFTSLFDTAVQSALDEQLTALTDQFPNL